MKGNGLIWKDFNDKWKILKLKQFHRNAGGWQLEKSCRS